MEDVGPNPAITRLLNDAAGGGDGRNTAEALLPLVYDELRRLAEREMRCERPGHTLQATALVHEAYLRLMGPSAPRQWEGRWQFFSAAAEAIRRILVDQARRRGRQKRGGGRQRVALDDVELGQAGRPLNLLALDEALAEFEKTHPQKAALVKLRYFAGLTMEEAAEAQGTSVATAARHWSYARAWLYAKLKCDGEPA